MTVYEIEWGYFVVPSARSAPMVSAPMMQYCIMFTVSSIYVMIVFLVPGCDLFLQTKQINNDITFSISLRQRNCDYVMTNFNQHLLLVGEWYFSQIADLSARVIIIMLWNRNIIGCHSKSKISSEWRNSNSVIVCVTRSSDVIPWILFFCDSNQLATPCG